MLGLGGLLIEELKRSLYNSGIKADVGMLGNEIVITIKSNELKEILVEKMPPEWRSFIEVECGDVKIRFKMVM